MRSLGWSRARTQQFEPRSKTGIGADGCLGVPRDRSLVHIAAFATVSIAQIQTVPKRVEVSGLFSNQQILDDLKSLLTSL
jgi:hypothetical protein